MKRFDLHTAKKREVIDITDAVQEKVDVQQGLCHVFSVHTTVAVTTADLDPGTDLDMLDAFEHMIPDLKYRHPHDPQHVPDHILSALIGTSLTLPVSDGKLVLGTWQRVVFVECNGPQNRTMHVTCWKT